MLLQYDLIILHQWYEEDEKKLIVLKTKLLQFLKPIETKIVPECIHNNEDVSNTHEAVEILESKASLH